MNKSESIAELAKALAKAQQDITGAKKDSSNPFFKSKYADLASVQDACKDALSKNGLSVTQLPGNTEGGEITIETVLMHESGEWLSSVFAMKPMKADPQSLGSCITYARRYALAAVCGVAQVDDDGNAASNKTETVIHYSPEEKQTFDRLVKAGNGAGLLRFKSKIKTDAYVGLYNSFNKDKVKNKQLVDQLINDAQNQISQYVDILSEKMPGDPSWTEEGGELSVQQILFIEEQGLLSHECVAMLKELHASEAA